jgi:hypothetical protein
MNFLSLNRRFSYLGFLLLVGLSLAVTSVAFSRTTDAEKDFAKMNVSLTDKFIIPRYRAFEASTSALSTKTTEYCVAPDTVKLGLIKHAFLETMITWQRIRVIRFGPIMKNARYARVQFWPDKRRTAIRQIRGALMKKDTNIINSGGLEGRSVALQNLSAFEYLFVTSPDNIFACRLMTAIASFQRNIAREVLLEWEKPRGYRDTILSAGKNNPTFGNNAAPATAFLNSIITLLDVIIRQKLEAPLGSDLYRASPRSAENWRTALSRKNIVANLNSIIEMFEAPDGFSDLLSKRKSKVMSDAIVRELHTVSRKVNTLPLPLPKAVLKAETRAQLEIIIQNLKDIRLLIRESVANTLGLTIGFNALDGD